MKLLSIILNLFLLSSCHENENKIVLESQTIADTTIKPCINDYDSLLIKYSNSFKATEIDLNKCLSEQAQSFFLKVDTNCLVEQKEYRNFIAIILAKLYIGHLQCCNQGYDLLSMKEGAANIIISAFEKLAGYKGENLEMLNSGTIVDYIDKESLFMNNKTVQLLRKEIKKEEQRIEKGNF